MSGFLCFLPKYETKEERVTDRKKRTKRVNWDTKLTWFHSVFEPDASGTRNSDHIPNLQGPTMWLVYPAQQTCRVLPLCEPVHVFAPKLCEKKNHIWFDSFGLVRGMILHNTGLNYCKQHTTTWHFIIILNPAHYQHLHIS